jgi:hypothetical protein
MFTPLPWVPTARKDLFYLPALQFFKCVLIVQGRFTLVLQACIYCALIKARSVGDWDQCVIVRMVRIGQIQDVFFRLIVDSYETSEQRKDLKGISSVLPEHLEEGAAIF